MSEENQTTQTVQIAPNAPRGGFETALEEAELACFEFLCDALGMKQEDRTAFVGVRGAGGVDCMVFDIGHLQTGDSTCFPAGVYHWRASADFFDRDRSRLQRTLMRLLGELPIGHDWRCSHAVRRDSCVRQFRIAPETNAVSDITTQSIEPRKGAANVDVFAATVQFDVVFHAGARSPVTAD